MPKIKTSKSAKKRIVRVTANNKIIRFNMSSQHRTTGKSSRSLDNSRKTNTVHKTDVKRFKKLTPYL